MALQPALTTTCYGIYSICHAFTLGDSHFPAKVQASRSIGCAEGQVDQTKKKASYLPPQIDIEEFSQRSSTCCTCICRPLDNHWCLYSLEIWKLYSFICSKGL